MIPVARCKGCNRKGVWVQDEDGVKILLDAVAPTYTIALEKDQPSSGPLLATRANPGDPKHGQAFVSHFATCPKAGEFSKGGRA